VQEGAEALSSPLAGGGEVVDWRYTGKKDGKGRKYWREWVF
jgi:hypothetical protein